MNKRYIKFIKYFLLIFFILVITLYFASLFILNSNYFKNKITKSISELQIKEIKVDFDYDIMLKTVKFKNNQIDFKTKKIQFDFDFISLLKNTKKIDKIIIEDPVIKLLNSEEKYSKSETITNKNKLKSGNNLKKNIKKELLKNIKIPVNLSINSLQLKNITLDIQKKYYLDNLDILINNVYLDKNNIFHSIFKIVLISEKNSNMKINNNKYNSQFSIIFDKTKNTLNHNAEINLNTPFKNSEKVFLSYNIVYNNNEENININNFLLKNKNNDLLIKSKIENIFNFEKSNIIVDKINLNLDINNIVKIAKNNFFSDINVDGNGKINLKADGTMNNINGVIDFNNWSVQYNNHFIDSLEGRIKINGSLNKLEINEKLTAKYISTAEFDEKISNLDTEVGIKIQNLKQITKINIDNISADLFNGYISLKGQSDFLKNLNYDIFIDNIGFFKYFDIPLMTNINGKLNIKGSLDNLVTNIDIIASNLDYSIDKNNNININKINFDSKIISNINEKLFFIENSNIKINDNSSINLNGEIIKKDKLKYNLNLNSLVLNLKKLNTVMDQFKKYNLKGTVSGKGTISGSAKKPAADINISLNNVGIDNKDMKLKVNNLNTDLWIKYPDKIVTQLKVKDIIFDKIRCENFELKLPYYLKDRSNYLINENMKLEKVSFKNISIRDIKSTFYMKDKSIILNNFYAAILDGQIGADINYNIENNYYNLFLSGVDIDLARAENDKDNSYISFVSRISGQKKDINGYFDITKIDKKILERMLNIIDPDRKNAQVNMIRDKLNIIGVVPKKITIKASNGYVDIVPVLGYRSKNLYTFMLSFILGRIQIEPIRRVPINSLVKETGIF